MTHTHTHETKQISHLGRPWSARQHAVCAAAKRVTNVLDVVPTGAGVLLPQPQTTQTRCVAAKHRTSTQKKTRCVLSRGETIHVPKPCHSCTATMPAASRAVTHTTTAHQDCLGLLLIAGELAAAEIFLTFGSILSDDGRVEGALRVDAAAEGSSNDARSVRASPA